MENVVNNPAPTQEGGDKGTGFLIGAVILVIFVAVLLYFGIPAIKNMGPVQVNVPAPDVKVIVPDNVNVQTTPSVPVTPTE